MRDHVGVNVKQSEANQTAGCLIAVVLFVVLPLAVWLWTIHPALLIAVVAAVAVIGNAVGQSQRAAASAAQARLARQSLKAERGRRVEAFRGSPIRATTDDRELASQLLTAALRLGSLTIDEYSNRCAIAAAASVRCELYSCLADLDLDQLNESDL